MIKVKTMKFIYNNKFINQPVIKINEDEYFLPNYFISINPKVPNIRPDFLFKTYKDCLIKYYRKNLGTHFNRHKEKQFKQMFVIENGKENTPHLHILLQSFKRGLSVNSFISFIMERFNKDLNKNLLLNDYNKQKIKPADYEVKLNYMLKEDMSLLYTHLDLLNGTFLE